MSDSVEKSIISIEEMLPGVTDTTSIVIKGKDCISCIVSTSESNQTLCDVLKDLEPYELIETSYGTVYSYNLDCYKIYVVSEVLFSMVSDTINSVEESYKIVGLVGMFSFILNNKDCICLKLSVVRYPRNPYDDSIERCVVKCVYKS